MRVFERVLKKSDGPGDGNSMPEVTSVSSEGGFEVVNVAGELYRTEISESCISIFTFLRRGRRRGSSAVDSTFTSTLPAGTTGGGSKGRSYVSSEMGLPDFFAAVFLLWNHACIFTGSVFLREAQARREVLVGMRGSADQIDQSSSRICRERDFDFGLLSRVVKAGSVAELMRKFNFATSNEPYNAVDAGVIVSGLLESLPIMVQQLSPKWDEEVITPMGDVQNVARAALKNLHFNFSHRKRDVYRLCRITQAVNLIIYLSTHKPIRDAFIAQHSIQALVKAMGSLSPLPPPMSPSNAQHSVYPVAAFVSIFTYLQMMA
jgi:hypothetical protein